MQWAKLELIQGTRKPCTLVSSRPVNPPVIISTSLKDKQQQPHHYAPGFPKTSESSRYIFDMEHFNVTTSTSSWEYRTFAYDVTA